MNNAILCTQNPGKLNELKHLFPKLNLSVMDQTVTVPEETGTTFAENAWIKADHGNTLYPNHWVIADDSGLCVPALDGAPGVYSARYAGEHGQSSANTDLLLKNLAVHEDRSAYFVCTLAAIGPDGKRLEVEGRLHGTIIHDRRGEGGFGYDPVFIPKGYDVTLAQLDPAEKNRISHRAIAATRLAEYIAQANGLW